MTYENFQLLLIEHEINTDPYHPFSLDFLFRYGSDRKSYGRKAKIPASEKEPILLSYWETGGSSGGNCWNDDPSEAYSTNAKTPPFEDLDKVLRLVAPTISHFHWLDLTAKVIEEGDETYYEYYGNYTNYGYQLVQVKRLYEELVAMGLISPA